VVEDQVTPGMDASHPNALRCLIAAPNLEQRVQLPVDVFAGVDMLGPRLVVCHSRSTDHPPSFQLVQVLEPREHHLFRRLLNLASQEHLV
jgi:hypothetical protein